MDNRSPTLTYGPSRPVAAAVLVAAVVVLGLVATTDDRLGRLLYLLTAAALLALGALDLIWNPRLIVGAAGVTVRGPSGSQQIRWSELDAVRVDERTRLGLASHALEIDAGERLLILSRRSLGGSDPREVADLIDAFRS